MLAARLYKLRPNNAVSFDDYLQYARTGLLESIDRFNPTRGVRFENFAAARIRGAILSGLDSENELAAQQKSFRGALVADRLELLRSSLGRSSNANVLEQWVQAVVTVAMGVLFERDDDDHPADESVSANPYASVELLHLRRKLQDGVGCLPEKEAQVIRLHYYEHQEFQAIAGQLKISKGRVSQLHAQALLRLKEMVYPVKVTNREL